MAYRLGVDVGGTFTDLLLLDEASGRFWRHKTPSTPADSSVGILTGVAAVCAAAGITPADVETLLHGTTVATNAVLEGKGARVGLIVTRGYRQVMQIARSFVPGGLAGWIIWPKPTPLAALEDTVEVGGRIDGRGREIEPLDEAGARAALETLRDRGVEAVTVSLMNAYLDGAHEARIGALAAEILPDVPVSLSHVVLPEMQEYERTLTTVANAAVRPIVGRYVRSLRGKLRDTGMAGRIALLRSDGGLMCSEKAEEHPVSLLMSGPAGGVAGRAVGRAQRGTEEHPDPGRRRHLDRRRADREPGAAADADDRGRASVGPRLVARRQDGRRRRRLDRQRARADQGAPRRPTVGGRGAGAGGVRQGRRAADRDRRQRGAGLPARGPARAAASASTGRRPKRRCRRSPTPWAST